MICTYVINGEIATYVHSLVIFKIRTYVAMNVVSRLCSCVGTTLFIREHVSTCWLHACLQANVCTRIYMCFTRVHIKKI